MIMRKGAASGRVGRVDERKVPCHGVGNLPFLLVDRGASEELGDLPSRAQDRQDRDRANLFVMGKINAPDRIELTYGTWLSPAHRRDAALNRPVWFGFLSGGHFPYLTLATLSLQATPAELHALRFPLLSTHWSMTRDEKRKTFFSNMQANSKSRLRRAFSRQAKDAPRQSTTVGKRT